MGLLDPLDPLLKVLWERIEVEVSQLVMSGTYLGRYPCGVRTRRVTSEDGYSMFGVRDTYFWRYLRAVADLPCDFRG